MTIDFLIRKMSTQTVSVACLAVILAIVPITAGTAALVPLDYDPFFRIDLMILSIVITWVIGLAPPLLIRFVFLRKPIERWIAIAVCAPFILINLGIFIAAGSQSRTHLAVWLIAYVSYRILRSHAGSATSNVRPTFDSTRNSSLPAAQIGSLDLKLRADALAIDKVHGSEKGSLNRRKIRNAAIQHPHLNA
jgi:hypothetical protein